MGDLQRLIVFDLDGTLIDSRRDLADSANALIAERGGRPLPEDAIVRMVGEGAAVLVRRALTAAGLDVDEASVPRFLELYDERLLQHTRVYPGMHEALEAIAQTGAAIAVLTNKPLAPATTLLARLGLQPFVRTAIGGDGRFPRKPDPSSLRYLIERYGASQETTVLVGDSRIDWETARAAGTHFCLARYGFSHEHFPTAALRAWDRYVESPSELPGRLSEILDRRSPRR